MSGLSSEPLDNQRRNDKGAVWRRTGTFHPSVVSGPRLMACGAFAKQNVLRSMENYPVGATG